MKTTFVIDDSVMRSLKEEATRRGCTMSELVETALRTLLKGDRPSGGRLAALPSFNGGGALVDAADRNALYDAMERR